MSFRHPARIPRSPEWSWNRYPLAETEIRSRWQPLICDQDGEDVDPFSLAYLTGDDPNGHTD